MHIHTHKYYQQVRCASVTGSWLSSWPIPGCVMIAEIISRRCFKCFDLVDRPQTIRKNATRGWAVRVWAMAKVVPLVNHTSRISLHLNCAHGFLEIACSGMQAYIWWMQLSALAMKYSLLNIRVESLSDTLILSWEELDMISEQDQAGEDQKSMAAVFGSQDLEKTWGIRCYPHSHAPEVSRYLSISGLSWNNGPVLCILWESSIGLAPPEPCRSRKRSGVQMLGQSLVSCIPWLNFIHFDPLWSTLGLSWCQLYPICGLSTEDLCGGPIADLPLGASQRLWWAARARLDPTWMGSRTSGPLPREGKGWKAWAAVCKLQLPTIWGDVFDV